MPPDQLDYNSPHLLHSLSYNFQNGVLGCHSERHNCYGETKSCHSHCIKSFLLSLPPGTGDGGLVSMEKWSPQFRMQKRRCSSDGGARIRDALKVRFGTCRPVAHLRNPFAAHRPESPS